MTVMTDQEKINKFDTLETLRTLIGGCFGDQDKIFASHLLDEDRAQELRNIAQNNGIKLSELEDIVTGHLYRSLSNPDHINKQIKKASEFFAKKLN
jgi:hypothetical protein